MKKYLLIASSLLLSSPLALAQTVPQPDVPDAPMTPAEPADGATPADPTKKEGTKDKKATTKSKTDTGTGSGALGAGADSKSKSGGASAKGDFASFDANGDGNLSQDEIKGDTSIKFKDADRNGDGKLSRGEYESSIHASPGSEVQDPAKQEQKKTR